MCRLERADTYQRYKNNGRRLISPALIPHSSHATHATQAIALRALRAMRALRKRKPQATQALDWLLR